MPLRKTMKCPHCEVICLCEWRFCMSPYMCVDHAGWFCLGCLKRIETTNEGQHFLADKIVYSSFDNGSYLDNPFRPEEEKTYYAKFKAHRIFGMPQDEAIIFEHNGFSFENDEDTIVIEPIGYTMRGDA